jgi:putative FmdB family regulatory protein
VPTYQYTCTDCGEPVEAVQKFTDAPLSACAVCGGRLRKVFSPVGIVFKGSGFYRTDSRNGSGSSAVKEKQPSESTSSPGTSDSGSSANGSAGKPAAKKSGEKASAGSASSSSSEKVA